MRGEVILVVDPDNWPTALGAIGFSGSAPASPPACSCCGGARNWPALAHSPFGSAQDGCCVFGVFA
jgi:hypothetical protein